MNKILITGKSSYIGNRFEVWLNKDTTKYKIQKITVRDESWKKYNFKGFDTVLHLAGIAHVSRDPKMEDLYYKVNRDLTIEIAKKAKAEGVRQFIFMSSIIVYGDGSTEKQVIRKDTTPKPSNFYGDSKLQAEKGINELEDDHFKVVIIRPPMIYGKGSKGNYPKLAKVAKMVPAFPDIDNQRSMLHVDNLCEFIKLLIDNNDSGLFFPQNSEYTKTSEMVRLVGEVHGRKVRLTKGLNFLINPFIGRVEILNKMFGNLVFDMDMSNYKQDYRVNSLVDSIKETER
ncbi:NAD-dependent epimerase [Lottiidibacillus patelloidae]|uniref:NAD-dependent epimerase n=1 Tax=Lottiidibacillus patelloidae TaxID=2670334 RepID=A0A263BRR5_9BACI|nr:NAD-dependent epimerase/dehydratase family protein [Lottiidibacillus patelloidae]OZM56403.1 NAD-dependent epimerase [Lottiidibacillus patelloidae]